MHASLRQHIEQLSVRLAAIEKAPMMRLLLVVLALMLPSGANSDSAERVGSLEALHAATDYALQNGKDVKTMDAKVTFFRSSYKLPPEGSSLPKNVNESLKGNDFWRVLFYVDITKSLGLRGQSLCIYVDAKSAKIAGSYDDCPF